ncbi:MAG TPA: diguanylate cyclase [Spirochaetota bacterium]|nr:diguanylate cyclase [Spirochaetota bacterium]
MRTVPLFLLIMLLLPAAVRCDRLTNPDGYPRAVGGVLDLREWDFDRRGTLPLSGDWEFYWNELHAPRRFTGDRPPPRTGYAALPGTWKDLPVNGAKLPGTGHATYRLVVLLDRPHHDLAIRTTTVSSAFAIYVNGTMANRAGAVGADPTASIPGCLPQVSEIESAPADRLDIVLQVSNFHYRAGGPWEHIRLGIQDEIAYEKWIIDIKSVFLFGCLFIMFLYHLALFLMRPQDRQFAYMALFCLIISLRPLFTGEYIITRILPAIPFDAVIRVLYLSYFFAVPAGVYLFKSLYPDETPGRQPVIVMAITGAFSIAVLFSPPLVFTRFVFAFFYFALAIIAAVIVENVIAVKRKRDGAAIILAGFAVLSVATINDNLNASYNVHSVNLVDAGTIIFVLCQALVLSRRLTGTFTRVEILSRELTGLNAGLEEQVKERTLDLECAYESMKEISVRDPLTGCFNRRFLEEQLPTEIERALRYGRPLSVIMGDIDHFKAINDTHGHHAGDLVLISISRAIIDTMRDRIDWVCRYGGEEFIIVMPETRIEDGSIVAERLRAKIENTPVEASGTSIPVTMSFGLTGFIPPVRRMKITMKDLIESADSMLYRAKNEGRNRVVTGSVEDSPKG